MQIKEIHVYQVDLPLAEGRYTWSDGRHVDVFDRSKHMQYSLKQ